MGGVYEADWFRRGVPQSSLIEQWSLTPSLGPAVSPESSFVGSIASDGHFLYLHGAFGLVKVGSGYGNTNKVFHL